MALEEITEQSTSDDVKEYAEQVVQEVQEERAGEKEKKGDAQITAEHADNEHRAKPKETPVAEKRSGDRESPLPGEQWSPVPGSWSLSKNGPGFFILGGADGTKVTAKAEKSEKSSKDDEAGKESWLDDGLKAEAAAYGIEESELSDFASREEFERALRLFDKSALEAGRKVLATDENGRTHGEDGKFLKKEPEPKADPKPEGKKEGKFEITLNKDVYDEEIVKQFTELRDHYESRLEALEARFIESDAKAQQQQFDSYVDSLGHADLFGKTDQEDAKQLQRRKDLHVAVRAQLIGLEQLGRPTDLSESLIGRVARMVFAEELGKKDIKNLTRRISKQSEKRQGGGATRPQDPREDPRDEADRLYREMSGAS